MFRLLVLLCGGLFLALLIGGQDRGQMRQGLAEARALAEAEALAQAAAPKIAVEPQPEPVVQEVVFVPAQPVVRPADPEPVVEAVAVAEPEPAPAAPEGRLRYVNTKSINVREGPGKDFPVVDRLTRDEAVLVVLEEGSPEEGWSLVRIEGDGLEGYVATRLLSDAPG